MIATVLIFIILLCYGAFQQGAVTVRDGMIVSAGIGLLAAGYFTFAGSPKPFGGRRLMPLIAGLLVLVVMMQLVPLPPGILRVLSPQRAEIASALDPNAWTPITLVPAQTVIWLLRLTACLLTLLMACDLASRLNGRLWMLAIPLLVVGSAEAALGMTQFFLSGPGTVARGTYVNRDHFAGLLELTIPVAVMMAMAVYRRAQKQFETPARGAIGACIMLGLASIMLVSVVFSESRMGFLSVLASLFFVGVVATSSLLSNKLSPRFRWSPVAAVGLLIGLGFIYLPTDQLISRFATLGNEDVTADTRARIWHESIPLIVNSAWLGSGLASYESAFLRYKHVAPMNSVGHAHNDYIQGLAELGILGFAPLLLLTVLAVRGAWQASTLPSTYLQYYFGIACLGSLAAILLHSTVDFNLYIPANALTVSWIGGMALGLYPRTDVPT